MKPKNAIFAFESFCALLAVVLVVRVLWRADVEAVNGILADNRQADGRRSGFSHGKRDDSGRAHGGADMDIPKESRPLDLPAVVLDEKLGVGEYPATASVSAGQPRSAQTDDDILAKGCVMPALKPAGGDANPVAGGVRSIKSADWNGAANLLVNALRAGDRFQVNHDELMDFLRGRDLLGWPESLRNWIGDELMTALRQDVPERAFEDLKSIEADTAAPAAMRDYSVQHISHLVTGGVIGQEGADYIWDTLKKNDPQTLSTALISLHRLSEQKPELVSAKEVREAAERLRTSTDERTRITAESILK